MRRLLLVAIPFAIVWLYGCDTQAPRKFAETPSGTPSSPATVPTPTPPTPMPTDEPPVDTPPTVDKFLLFIYENHGFNQLKAGAPWLWSEAGKKAVLMNHYACGHPSLGNYLCIGAGERLLTDDAEAKYHNLSQQNVFYNAIKKGRTARIYVESISTATCPLNKIGKSVSRHETWPYFRKESGSYAACKKNVIGLYNLQKDIDAAALPNVGEVVANQCNNGHDCSIGKYDAFAKKYVTNVLNGPDYKSGRLLVCSTGDEDNRKEGNRVMTQCWHESFEHLVVTTKMTHFSLSALMSRFGDSAPLRKAATAPRLDTALGLRIG